MPRLFSSITNSVHPAKNLLKRQLQWLLFLRALLLTLLLSANFLLLESASKKIVTPPLTYISYFIAGVYLFTIGSAFLLQKSKNLTRFAYIQTLMDSCLVSLLVFFSGGNQSIFTSIYFFPIIAGSFLLMLKGGLTLAAASTMGYGLILLLEYFAYQPDYFYQFWYLAPSSLLVVANFFAVHGITFFLVAVLSALLSTRLQRTESALSRTTQDFDQLSLLYKQIFDDITTGIITIDSDLNITSMNPAAERISGYSAADVLHHSLRQKLPDIELKRRGNIRPIADLQRKDGIRIPVGYSWTPLHTKNGAKDCQVITLQDLSEIKKMEDQVRQAEKMAALGEMAAGIAHEFRNPLAAISGSAQILREELRNNPAHHGLMKIIVRECSRLETSIADFLQFSKPAVPEKEWLALQELLDDAVGLLRQSPDWPEQVIILPDIPEKLAFWGDAQQLKRVLINLIQNSCQAIRDTNGEIRIMAREEKNEAGEEKTIINIEDSGPGIAPAIAAKIFDPFFTTRDNGTGLGLAIVHQIIDSHGGDIKVEGTQQTGGGANFTITLPLP
jgi:two-component system sensor histidine kinase PilS (NtrC family)